MRGLWLVWVVIGPMVVAPCTTRANGESAYDLWRQHSGRTKPSAIEAKQLERIGRGTPRAVPSRGGMTIRSTINSPAGAHITYDLALTPDHRGTVVPVAKIAVAKADGRTIRMTERDVELDPPRSALLRRSWVLQDPQGRAWRLPEHLVYGLEHGMGGVGSGPDAEILRIDRHLDQRGRVVSRGVEASRRPGEGLWAAPPPVSSRRVLLKRLYDQVLAPRVLHKAGAAYVEARTAGIKAVAEQLGTTAEVIEQEMQAMLHPNRRTENAEILHSGLAQTLGDLGRLFVFQPRGRLRMNAKNRRSVELQLALGRAFARLTPKQQQLIWATRVDRRSMRSVYQGILGTAGLVGQAYETRGQAEDQLVRETRAQLRSVFGPAQLVQVAAALMAQLKDKAHVLIPRIAARPQQKPSPPVSYTGRYK